MSFRVGLSAMAIVALAGCPSEEPPPMCITVDTACAPLYTPTFANVYANTIKPSCGAASSSCHSASGSKGGLSFADQQTAYDGLVNGRVTAGDAGCSELVVRTSSPGTDYEMPPGAPLSAAAQCALRLWVENGAQP